MTMYSSCSNGITFITLAHLSFAYATFGDDWLAFGIFVLPDGNAIFEAQISFFLFLPLPGAVFEQDFQGPAESLLTPGIPDCPHSTHSVPPPCSSQSHR